MNSVISTENKPIKLWLDDIEDSALGQAKNLANLPFIFKHIAIMPDCHLGYGMPIGGVMATLGVIIPNAVGVDIGCGMSAVKTSLSTIDKDTLRKIMSKIRQNIPVGFKKHKYPNYDDMPNTNIVDLFEKQHEYIIYQEHDNVSKSLGTLGGGNHFIEIQEGSDGFIWIMVHSGSRNLGKKVADHYNKIAINNNERWFSMVETEKQLAFLPLDTEEGQEYLFEMQYCVDFALQNRKVMMNIICNIFKDVLPNCIFLPCIDNNKSKLINIAHNYATMEHHFGKNVMVHRKGATRARIGEIGIIPGSQGSASYIIKGLGNPDSFESCSHGAGRKMGRKQAQRELDLETEKTRLDDNGIIHSIRHASDLDEATGAYKDIATVMSNQKDLVDIIIELKPLAVIKG